MARIGLNRSVSLDLPATAAVRSAPRRLSAGVLALTLTLAATGVRAQDADSPYRDASLPVADRVEDLLSRMTLKEKVGEMTQLNVTMVNASGEQRDLGLVREKARDLILNHHVGSFLNGEAEPQEDWAELITGLQKIAVEESRLGIPILYGIDHMHGASYLKDATLFPHNLNIGATFNPAHAAAAAEVTAFESAHLGHRWNFAPVLDLGREPRWARVYETYGESPYLAARMGEAYVTGLQNPQGGNPYGVAATAKHFLGYSDPRSGWDRTPVDISDQTLYEMHLPPFRAAIDAGIKTVMLNSGEINGVPVHASKRIVTDLLRDELGFEGVVVTDWDDIGKLFNYHYTAETYKEATRQVIEAGVDMSMTPTSLAFNDAMMELLDEGAVTEARLDESVRRILTLKFELGLFEHPYPETEHFDRLARPENVEKAFRAAVESLVLLKNDGTLPFATEPGTILVAGPSADSKRNLSGGWTIAWQGGEEARHPERVRTIRQALAEEFPGAEILMPADWRDAAELASLADRADLVVAAIGEEPYTEFVGNLTDMALPREQIEMVQALTAGAAPVVGVYIGGRPRLVTEITDGLAAFLWAGLPGNEGGRAVAAVLSGRHAPTGKLPFSYPRYPSHFAPHNHKPSDVYFFDPSQANDIQQGEASVWQYPFGYGLTYTTFSYSDLSVPGEMTAARNMVEPASARVTVTNTGDRAGTETVLWFVQDVVGSVTRPVRELKHMEAVTLEPGESRTLEFPIRTIEELAYPVPGNAFRVEPGEFRVRVGGLQQSIRLNVEEMDMSLPMP